MKKIVPFLLVLLVAGAGGWIYFDRIATTPIGKLLADPRAYDGKTITIGGEVTDRASVLMFKYYKLKDGTGEIMVTSGRIMPPVGAIVRVKGKVREAFSFGNSQAIVFEETEQ